MLTNNEREYAMTQQHQQQSQQQQPQCAFCTKRAIIDGKTKSGPWAYMCGEHFVKFGFRVKGLYTTLDNIGTPGRKPYSD